MGEACALLPSNFGLAVQLALVVVCVITLVVKKLLREGREIYPRSWFVLLLDGSKQMFGLGFAHVLNLLAAMVLSKYMIGDACDWYWLNIVIDATLGVFLEYVLLKGFTALLERQLGEGSIEFRSGEYFEAKGQALRKVYAKQLGLWFMCILGMKLIVSLLIVVFGDPIFQVASTILWLVSWNSKLKLVTVMLLSPTLMTALQVWLTDNFIKQYGASHSQLGLGCLGCCIDGLVSLESCITGEKDVSRSLRETGRQPKADYARPLLEKAFEEEKARLKEQLQDFAQANERLAEENEELVVAESRLLPDKERAEAQARHWEERMRDAMERAYKAEQEKRLILEEQNLLRDRLAVKEDREKQLLLRIQQLEFSYKAAGNAANAVFAAEVSAATVAAQGRLNRHQAIDTEALALTDVKRGNVIDEFCSGLQSLPPPEPPRRSDPWASAPGGVTQMWKTAAIAEDDGPMSARQPIQTVRPLQSTANFGGEESQRQPIQTVRSLQSTGNPFGGIESRRPFPPTTTIATPTTATRQLDGRACGSDGFV